MCSLTGSFHVDELNCKPTLEFRRVYDNKEGIKAIFLFFRS